MDVSPLHFYCIRNRWIYCTEMYVYCIEIYMYCKYSSYILYRSVCSLLIVIHYIECIVYLLTPRKYNVLNENIVFDLCNVFQERNPGIK